MHPAQATPQTDSLLRRLKQGEAIVVPVLWFQEMANALLMLERRNRISSAERREALAILRAFDTQPDFEGAALAFGRISELA